MRAGVLTDWEKLEMKDVPTPEPGPGQVLIKTIYGGICGSDVTVFHHHHPTATVPRIMCHEILGTVEKINGEALHLKPGDRVVVHPLSHCGVCEACRDGNFHVCRSLHIMGLHVDGGFAEYVAADADVVFPVPDDLPDEIAILTEPFAVGFHAHMQAGTRPGDSVFVIGGGPIGLVSALCAGYFGAQRVVVSEPNPARVEIARQLGIETINPNEVDVHKAIADITGGRGFERVVEASGTAAGAALVVAASRIRGVVVALGIPSVPMSYETNKLILKEVSLVGSRVYPRDNFIRSLQMLVKMYRAGEVDLSKLIDRTIPLAQLAEGIDMQSRGVNNGKILVDTRAGG